jgi:hypothetical protein
VVMLGGGFKRVETARIGNYEALSICFSMRTKEGKMKVKSILGIFVSLTILILWGCGPGPYRMYPGPRLPKSQVALLQWDSAINVILVDGKLIPRCNKIEMFPGDHNVQVGYSGTGFRSRHDRLINFSVEAGHRYRISHSTDVSSEFYHWDAWVENITYKED